MGRIEQRGGIPRAFRRANMRWTNIYEDLERYFYENRLVSFPSFSQKQGICVSDSVSNVLWWADRIRDVFWNAEVFSNTNVTYDTDVFQVTNAGEVQTFDYRNPTAFPVSRRMAIQLWIRTSLYRIIQILQGQPIEIGPIGLQRTPSVESFAPQQCSLATGNLAAFHLYQYFLMFLGNLNSKTYTTEVEHFGIPQQGSQSALNMAFNLYGIGTEVQALRRDNPAPPGSFPVAMVIVTSILDSTTGNAQSAHATSCVKIYDVWHYIDNEIGITVPILHPNGRPFSDEEVNGPGLFFHYGVVTGPTGAKSTRIQIRKVAPSGTQIVWDKTPNSAVPVPDSAITYHESDDASSIGFPPGHTSADEYRIVVYSSRAAPRIPAPLSSSSSSSSAAPAPGGQPPVIPDILSGTLTVQGQQSQRIAGTTGDDHFKVYSLANDYLGKFREGGGAAADPAPMATLKLDGMPAVQGRFYRAGGVRRTKTSRRPLSLPRRTGRRSSSSSTKRYTRRRRALRS